MSLDYIPVGRKGVWTEDASDDAKKRAAIEIQDALEEARRGYSGALKRWYGKTEQLSWRIKFNLNNGFFSINVTPRPVPVDEDISVTWSATDEFPYLSSNRDEVEDITHQNGEDTVERVRRAANTYFDSITELREVIRENVKSVLRDHYL